MQRACPAAVLYNSLAPGPEKAAGVTSARLSDAEFLDQEHHVRCWSEYVGNYRVVYLF